MTADQVPVGEVWRSPERTVILRRTAERNSASSAQHTRTLLAAADLAHGQAVVDLACGPGDPTLEIAQRVGPAGSVVGIDPSEGALRVASERAEKAGIHNVRFQVSEASTLPLEAHSVDRVTCRFGVMFFEPLVPSLVEVHRVLRPGGRAAFMVWGTFHQPHFESTVGVILRHLGKDQLPANLATPFRFANPGPLEDALGSAGFKGVTSATATVDWLWNGSSVEARDDFRDGAMFFRPLLDAIPPASQDAVWTEVEARLRSFAQEGTLVIPETVRIITASV